MVVRLQTISKSNFQTRTDFGTRTDLIIDQFIINYNRFIRKLFKKIHDAQENVLNNFLYGMIHIHLMAYILGALLGAPI